MLWRVLCAGHRLRRSRNRASRAACASPSAPLARPRSHCGRRLTRHTSRRRLDSGLKNAISSLRATDNAMAEAASTSPSAERKAGHRASVRGHYSTTQREEGFLETLAHQRASRSSLEHYLAPRQGASSREAILTTIEARGSLARASSASTFDQFALGAFAGHNWAGS